jgi:hypothetical protein
VAAAKNTRNSGGRGVKRSLDPRGRSSAGYLGNASAGALSQKGAPSRAEITDAAMAERAECVMLNKGPYTIEAVIALDDILRRMQAHQVKKTSLLGRLRW